MKQFFSALIFLFACTANVSSQSPLYIQFDASCMNQLEYRYTYTGQDLLMYAINKGEDELYFFKINSNAQTTTVGMPKGTISCQNVTLNSAEVNAINAGGRLAFIVHKVQSGWLSMPVEAAGQIFRAGSSFVFRSPNYDFLLDTSNIDYARNLSQPGVASPVYLTGMRDYDCRRQYAFRLEPATDDLPRMDIELIPGVGIVSNRAGRNGSEMEQNIYRLLKINGLGMEDYITANCRGIAQPNNSNAFITGWPQNQAEERNDNAPFFEPDKEGYSPKPNAQPGGINCPEKPGFGYHLVQQGESLNSIARMYNLDSKQLADWNKVTEPNKIEICQKIWLSPQGGTASPSVSGYKEHVVQKGETVSSIARKYYIQEYELRKINKFPATGDIKIQPGQRLIVSKTKTTDATTVTPPPAATTPVAANQVQYKVQKGETMESVSRRYGYTTEYFRYINRNVRYVPAEDDKIIPEGVVLLVSDSKCERSDLATFRASQPVKTSTNSPGNNVPNSLNTPQGSVSPAGTSKVQFEYVGEYIVKTGDTLLSIARQYNLPVEKLAAANNLRLGQEPQPRDILKIPK